MVILLSIAGNAQTYNDFWQNVDKNIQAGLPKSANSFLDKIEKRAIVEHNAVEQLKTALYRFKIYSLQDEDPIKTSISYAEKYLDKLEEPAKAIMNVAIAGLYENYLNDHEYYIGNYTEIVGNLDEVDMKFWDETSFRKKIEKHYAVALAATAQLKNTQTKLYKDALSLYADKNSKKKFDFSVEPTLYDYVLHKIIDFHRSDEEQNDETAGWNTNDWWCPAKEFLNITLPESNSTAIKILRAYQLLLAFDMEQNFDKAVIYNDMHRLEFLKNYFGDEKSYNLYFNALQVLKEKNIKNSIVTSIMAFQAEILMDQFENNEDTMFSQNYVKALSICDEALRIFPKSIGAKQCKEYRDKILAPELTITMQHVVTPDRAIPIALKYRNTTNPHYRIYKISEEELNLFDDLNGREIVKRLLQKSIFKDGAFEIPAESDYREHSSLMALPELPCGSYYVMFAKDSDFSIKSQPTAHFFQVSNLSYVRIQTENGIKIYVRNRETGDPIPEVTVKIFNMYWDYKQYRYVPEPLHVGMTDDGGCMECFAGDHNIYNKKIDLYYGDDKLISETHFSMHSYRESDKMDETTCFFTDRAIYRPGQTVYFRGIILRGNNKDKELAIDKTTKVIFLDENDEEIANQTLTTNEYGSFDGSFVIPLNLLNGDYRLENESGSLSFKVEEYKRPTFEVKFETPDTTYKLNENVTLSGSVKALAGFGLDNIQYKYRVVRRPYFPFRFWWWNDLPESNDEQIACGTGKTDNDGRFDIHFNLKPEAAIKAKLKPIFNYTIIVEATNAGGETQYNSHTLKAGYNELIISTDVVESVNRKNLKDYIIKITNMNDRPVKSKISRKFYKLADNDRFISDFDDFDRKLLSDTELDTLFPEFDYYAPKGDNQDKRLVYEDIILVDGDVPLFPDIQIFTGGKYIIELSSLEDELSEISRQISIYDLDSHRMPSHSLCWSFLDAYSAQPTDTVNFYIGTSAKDVPVLVTVKHGNEVRYSQLMSISDEVLEIPYVVSEKDRNGLCFQAFFVKHNTVNIVNETISVPYDNLKLDIKLDVERLDFLPGADETWHLTIRDYREKAVMASLMAGMYDASLDVFAKNSWQFDVFPKPAYSEQYFPDKNFSRFNIYHDNGPDYETYVLFYFKMPSQNLLSPFHSGSNIRRWLSGGDFFDEKCMSLAGKIVYESNMEENMEENVEDHVEENVLPASPEPVLRENFNETAFFYPNLTTNEDGSATFSFKMPDALTRWNLLMLAYTKDLKVGRLEMTINTKKPLMIMADMPRFCYEKDTLYLVANVINTGDKTCKPTAKLEVFDATTMQPVEVILSSKEILMEEIPSGRSKSASWKVAFKKDMGLLAFRFTAMAENFSDAEQHFMPILSDEVFMTQTLPITVKANSEKTFAFDGLMNNENERNYGLILNFSINPVWYAIQSLPYLADESGQYVDVAFCRFYANAVAAHVAHNLPNLKNYIQKWQIESPEALSSQLQKDENLKAILLQETPWVMDAKNETEQRARIANLFDLNALSNRNSQTLKLIRDKQKYNGGWPWFEGMPESPLITEYILKGFGKLKKMNALGSLSGEQQDLISEICGNACKFVQNAIAEQYHKIDHAQKEKYAIPLFVINELYATSYFDLKGDKNFDEAKDFFLNKLEKSWNNFDFAAQAAAALVLYRFDRPATAGLIVKSLRERAQHKEDLGMYWARDNDYCYFVPQVSDHAQIMEAFAEISPVMSELDEMRIWLLTQKHTHIWENARSSADAIYALLMRGSDWLHDEAPVDIKVGNQVIETANGEAGTGFIQKHWDAASIGRESADIHVNNSTSHVVWGGLFRQYFVPIDKVKSSNTSLSIKRELFVERVGEKGVYLVPVENESVRVGDKITVKITFESTQDLEFVFLKDLRAACLEPVEQISSYQYADHMFYYQSTTDTYMGFYFDNLPKGKHQVSHSMYVAKEGSFSGGHALIQCLYAPEYSAYSDGIPISVSRAAATTRDN